MDHESHWEDGIGSFSMFSKQRELKIRVIFITSVAQIANIFDRDSFHVDSESNRFCLRAGVGGSSCIRAAHRTEMGNHIVGVGDHAPEEGGWFHSGHTSRSVGQ